MEKKLKKNEKNEKNEIKIEQKMKNNMEKK